MYSMAHYSDKKKMFNLSDFNLVSSMNLAVYYLVPEKVYT